MPRSTACCLVIAGVIAIGGCGFTPKGQTAGETTGAANSTGTVTGTGNSTGSAATSGSGTGNGGSNGGMSTLDGNCGSVSRPAAKVPPDILIVEDRSGSMDSDANDRGCNGAMSGGCGAMSKWAQVVSAIKQVVVTTDTSVNWGLKFFADADNTCGVSNMVAVPVASGNGAAVVAQFTASTNAAGGLDNGSKTPTRLAVNAAAGYLKTVTDTSPKYILLATDGLPNCMPGGRNNSTDDSAGATTAIADALTAGISTFVVGIGNTMGATTLNAFAAAGGVPQTGAATAFYQVMDTASLVTALNTILGVAASCNFAVGTAPNSSTDNNHIDVYGDGTLIPPDPSHTDGWDYANAAHTSVQVYGPRCDAIMAGTISKVTVTFRCIIG